MRISILFLALVISIATSGQRSMSKDERNIRLALVQDTEAWNRGDIEAFMDTYDRSDSLMFIGKSGVTYGWQKTLENYKKGYPDTAAMGKLRFNIIQVKKLSNKFYSVTGQWFLTRTIGNVSGSFTLLWEKKQGKWVIIQDHSS